MSLLHRLVRRTFKLKVLHLSMDIIQDRRVMRQ
jgi:hypothetical protein